LSATPGPLEARVQRSPLSRTQLCYIKAPPEQLAAEAAGPLDLKPHAAHLDYAHLAPSTTSLLT